MLIAFPNCDFKCGVKLCHNSDLYKSANIDVDIDDIIDRYLHNDITKAIIFQGMEPLFDLTICMELITSIRNKTVDDIVIYTGYNRDEQPVREIKRYILQNSIKNVILKTGRYIENSNKIYDATLGVYLASDNQLGEIIS